ncbi:hypothetical protein [Bradyrhizobium prioriisuperbiae]|uniref:hypothetical protein n=1 Tax=Bradyrhizobium prioriisuperbiae TaxID=2854389 RepID=UPI0028E63F63|nr:hypothetical protein [Bradyrhizobium prioritasuperba]
MTTPSNPGAEMLAPCPFCKKSPAQKVGPPALARCITPGCEGKKLRAYTMVEWAEHTRAAAPAAGVEHAPANCSWPAGRLFSFHNEPGEHDPCYVVMPDGAMLALNHHATPGIDIARSHFIISACNTALTAGVERNAEDEAYETGERDGYESAVQDFDLATGGDGEFKGSTIPGETIDVPAMKARVIARFAAGVEQQHIGYISPSDLYALKDAHGVALVVACAGYDTVIPVYIASLPATPVVAALAQSDKEE